MVKRVIVGAHYGLKDWLAQRLTAVVLALYAVLFAFILVWNAPTDYEQWRALFAPQWLRLATFVMFVSLFWHAWIGVRDILMDYIQATWLRLALEVVVVVLLVAYTAWAIQILWSV